MNHIVTQFGVNWIDGMKINREHFISVQNFISDSVRDAIAVRTNAINYGLLPIVENPIIMNTSMDHYGTLTIKVEECHAITPNGNRIQISRMLSDEPIEFQKEINTNGDEILYYIFLAVLPYTVPYGEADPQEYPPRIPYLKSTYTIELFSVDELKKEEDGLGGNYLMLGRINIGNGKVELDKNYIPPCSSILCDSRLEEMYQYIYNFYTDMEKYAIQISQKIHIKKQHNSLSDIIDRINERILLFLGSEINHFSLLSPYVPPCEMIASIAGFARVIRNFVDAHSGAGKEELLNYFSEWCSVTQGEFEKVFSTLISNNYNHNHIYRNIEQINTFIKMIEGLYNNLSHLDYIGKKPDGGIFVAETTNENRDIIRRTRSLLVD
jgi:hypothetical protein